jgi:hypothetical protein
MDDGPGVFTDTLETWERYLKELQNLPDTDIHKQGSIQSAEAVIAAKRRGN